MPGSGDAAASRRTDGGRANAAPPYRPGGGGADDRGGGGAGDRGDGRPAIRGAEERVTSLSNPAIKDIRALHMRKRRAETGLFLAEGQKLVIDALAAGWPVETLLVATAAGGEIRAGEPRPAAAGRPGAAVSGEAEVEGLGSTEDHAEARAGTRIPVEARAEVRPSIEARTAETVAAARAAGARIIPCAEAVVASVTKRDNPQALVGVFRQRLLGLDAVDASVAAGTATTWVVLEGVRDPGNLGTIIRTADAAGASGVVLVGDTTDPFSLEAVRATMGSLFHVPLVKVGRDDFLAWRPSFPGRVVGTHLAAAVDYRSLEPSEPALLVMGTEQSGLTDAMAAACDVRVKIPMAGAADSLNLAVSTAVALYELRRKWV